jgi:hypothetical protein
MRPASLARIGITRTRQPRPTRPPRMNVSARTSENGPRLTKRPWRAVSSCDGGYGHVADSVRAVRTIGYTVGSARTAIDGLRWCRIPA